MHKTVCPYDCPTTCGLLAETDGERITSIKGDPDDPVSRGLICRKMQHYEQSIHSPQRLLTPLKRNGKKGQGNFLPISWDEAIKTITDHWQKTIADYGPESILPFYYSGTMGLIHRNCSEALFNKMGACSLIKTLCSSAKSAGYASVMGETACLDPRELTESDLYIIWGSNMKATRLQALSTVVKARKQGKKVILIESYAHDMAPFSDQVVLITPGTDGALALAMMHVLEKEGLTDNDFLSKETKGFTAFRKTLPTFTPEWAETITGVPAGSIVALARQYAAASAPAIILGSGNSRYGNGGMTVRLLTILSTFTGAWKQPGGGLCGCTTGDGPYVDVARITRPDFRPNTGRKININQLAAALCGNEDEPPIRSLYVYASNPVGSVSDQQSIQKGLLNPGLFTVVHERFMTDTARYADIILPATFSVEQTDCYSSYGYRSFATAYKMLSAPGECKSNWDVFRLLAKAMGYTDKHFDKTDGELLNELLQHPMPELAKLSQLQKDIVQQGGVISPSFADHTVWKTKTGRIQIMNKELDHPLPAFIEPHGKSNALKLIAIPSTETLNSVFLERDSLVERRGAMCLAMHPDDAAKRNIIENDAVVARNELGEVCFTARITPLIMKGTVAAPGIYTCKQSMNKNLVNTLHHGRLSDLGEATTLNDNTVEVYKC